MNDTSQYIIDTSAVIDLATWFRKTTFPSLWKKLESLAASGYFSCPREVKRELDKKSGELAKCLKKNKVVISEQASLDLIKQTTTIDKKYPKLKVGKRRSHPNPTSADPWIIALALMRQAIVVSSEEAKPDAKEICTIPDACRIEGLKCLKLPELFEDLGIQI